MFHIENFPSAKDMRMDDYTRFILRIQNELLRVLKEPQILQELPEPIRTNTLSAIALNCGYLSADVISDALKFLDSQGYISAYASGTLFISWDDSTWESGCIQGYREDPKAFGSNKDSSAKSATNTESITNTESVTTHDEPTAADTFGNIFGEPDDVPASGPYTVLANVRRVCKILNAYTLYYDTPGLNKPDHSRASAYEAAYQMVYAAVYNTTPVMDSHAEAARSLIISMGIEPFF